ncbi:hypothetical protein AB0C84_40395 [Actinomadura sp. NPDC048955]|uniref:hypothetical protein n=1 Tax=Actinomadura sp. NPDC048955 TaxID=3158228 RepID=UPI0033F5FAC9
MAECVALLSPVCAVKRTVPNPITGTANAVGNGALEALAHSIQEAIGWVITGTFTWWVQVPSPDLQDEAAVYTIQGWMMPIATAVAVMAVIVAGGKMAITGKANSLTDVGQGLVTIAATGAIGVIVPTLLLQAGDAWSSWVISTSADGDFVRRLVETIAMAGAPVGLINVLGVFGLLMAIVQALLMVFRQASIIVLAGMLPLASAGTLAPKTRVWFTKITGWGLAFVFYKPAAAAIYAIAITMVGKGSDIRTIFVGYAMMALSLIALPVLMKLTTWATGSVAQSSGQGGLLSAALGGAVAVGSFRASSGGAGGMSASDQARHMQRRPDQSPSAPPAPRPSGPPGRQDGDDSQPPVTLAVKPTTPPSSGQPLAPGGHQFGDKLTGKAGSATIPTGASPGPAMPPSGPMAAGSFGGSSAAAAFGPAGLAAGAAAGAVRKGMDSAKKGADSMTDEPDGSA